VHKNKILIVGLPKSGTSALTYKIASCLPNATLNFEPQTLKGLSDVELHKKICETNSSAITKCLFYSRQKIVLNEIEKLYTKKLWIIRDPRDRLISAILYRWYWKHNRNKDQFYKTLETVKEKEQNPAQVPFSKIIACSFNLEDFLKEENRIVQATINQITDLETDWLIVNYRDIINNDLEAIEAYLNFKLDTLASSNATLKRVRRTGQSENWKNWFTEKDVTSFQGIYTSFFNYFKLKEEWQLNKNQNISKSEASDYLIKLNTKPNLFKRLKDKFF